MRTNPAARQQAERLALAVVENHGAPISLRDVAWVLGWSCQRVARLLLRLADGGEVLREIVEHKDTNYRLRQRVIYRPCPKIAPGLPGWLSPTACEVRGARHVAGRYG